MGAAHSAAQQTPKAKTELCRTIVDTIIDVYGPHRTRFRIVALAKMRNAMADSEHLLHDIIKFQRNPDMLITILNQCRERFTAERGEAYAKVREHGHLMPGHLDDLHLHARACTWTVCLHHAQFY